MKTSEIHARMRALLGEGAGAGRTNATTTLEVTLQSMAGFVEALKVASKGFESSLSQLPGMLKAAHELHEEELYELKKLMDQSEETAESLKKWIQRANQNRERAGKLLHALKSTPPPSSEIPPEPHPTKPLKRTVLSKPNLSAEDWMLNVPGALPDKVKSTTADLNKASWKALDAMEDALAGLPSPADKKTVRKAVQKAYQKYLEALLVKLSKWYGKQPQAVAQKLMTDGARSVLNNPGLSVADLW